jgi:UDP-N-acetylglucosamine diphosphorylase/glucosamine-1-phosphate N-acetyltransferase
MRICLYEDRRAADLNPLTLTRPASDLLCGLTTLGAKQVRHFAPEVVGHLCRPALAEWLRARAPGEPVNDPGWLRSAPTVLVNARWLPPHAFSPSHRLLFADGPFVATAGDEIAYAVLDPRRLQSLAPATADDCLADWLQTLPCRAAGGTVVGRAWDLLDRNGDELAYDFEATCDPAEAGYHPAGFALVGPADRLFVHPTARVDPYVVADTTGGPVVIGAGAVVTAFTRLEGPCGIGAHTHVSGARVRAGTTVGPHCRIGGEIEGSIVLGYTNKHHDGFLGHSYVGEWVNLGAGTTTADLRCDYRPVRVPLGGAEVPTGRTKLGSLIGDHAKTGLGVLLDCGTVLGAFAQVLPTGAHAPRAVPAFHRVGPGGERELDPDRLMATAATVMKRRGRELAPQQQAVYRALARAGEPAAPPGVPELPATLPLRKSA